ncbi:MAG: hypothetical protein HY319_24755 [Armatimonadetes bacterium]|nr:hypothetical protein [Armatimonadota bacterium]
MKRLVGLLLGLLVLSAGVGALFFYYQTRDYNFDQAEVEQLAARMLPGARPVEGVKGVVAVDLKLLEAAVLAPSLAKVEPAELSGGELRFVIAEIKQLPTDTKSMDKWREIVSKATEKRESGGMKSVEKNLTVLSAGGRPQPALRSVSEVGSARIRDDTTVFLIGGRAVVLQVAGPEATFNQPTMDTFLSRLELAGPLPTPPISMPPVPVEAPAMILPSKPKMPPKPELPKWERPKPPPSPAIPKPAVAEPAIPKPPALKPPRPLAAPKSPSSAQSYPKAKPRPPVPPGLPRPPGPGGPPFPPP